MTVSPMLTILTVEIYSPKSLGLSNCKAITLRTPSAPKEAAFFATPSRPP